MEGTKTIFFVQMTQKQKQKKIEPVQKILYWFKKFCTGSEKIVPKAKIELHVQHIHGRQWDNWMKYYSMFIDFSVLNWLSGAWCTLYKI